MNVGSFLGVSDEHKTRHNVRIEFYLSKRSSKQCNGKPWQKELDAEVQAYLYLFTMLSPRNEGGAYTLATVKGDSLNGALVNLILLMTGSYHPKLVSILKYFVSVYTLARSFKMVLVWPASRPRPPHLYSLNLP